MMFTGWRRLGDISDFLNSQASLHGFFLIDIYSSFVISQDRLGRFSIKSVFFLLLALLRIVIFRERQNDLPANKALGL